MAAALAHQRTHAAARSPGDADALPPAPYWLRHPRRRTAPGISSSRAAATTINSDGTRGDRGGLGDIAALRDADRGVRPPETPMDPIRSFDHERMPDHRSSRHPVAPARRFAPYPQPAPLHRHQPVILLSPSPQRSLTYHTQYIDHPHQHIQTHLHDDYYYSRARNHSNRINDDPFGTNLDRHHRKRSRRIPSPAAVDADVAAAAAEEHTSDMFARIAHAFPHHPSTLSISTSIPSTAVAVAPVPNRTRRSHAQLTRHPSHHSAQTQTFCDEPMHARTTNRHRIGGTLTATSNMSDAASAAADAVAPPTPRSSKPKRVKNFQLDDPDGHLRIRIHSQLTSRFQILRLLGQGTYGRVVEAYDHALLRHVAIKIVKAIPKYCEAAKNEINVLNCITTMDPLGVYQCVRLLETFDFHGHICMVFELFAISMFDFFKANAFAPFSIDHVRDFAAQMLRSVAYMHTLGIIHTDLKPENLMLVSSESRPAPPSLSPLYPNRLEPIDTSLVVIDFGSAIFERDYHSSIVSTRHYRAPEIILGLPWSFPCDMWSVGCILVELFTGSALFQTHDNVEHLCMMEILLGSFPSAMLACIPPSSPCRSFFTSSTGRVAFPTSATPDQHTIDLLRRMECLDTYIARRGGMYGNESEQTLVPLFCHLVSRMLCLDPERRITAKEAKYHPFFLVLNQ